MAAVEASKPLLDAWRQGDFALGEFKLPFIDTDEEGPFAGEIAPVGVAVISQSCDIIRDHTVRPYVQVAALHPANDAEIRSIEAGEKPQYGFISGLNGHKLVVDFDFTATVTKSTVATWQREIGCEDDAARRRFAEALARHKLRFAFPNAFNNLARPLRRWIDRRATKAGASGQMLRAIGQIRVKCSDWANPIDLAFIAVLSREATVSELKEWGPELKKLEDLARATYPEAVFYFSTWHELSAAEYVASDRLDLDGLSEP